MNMTTKQPTLEILSLTDPRFMRRLARAINAECAANGFYSGFGVTPEMFVLHKVTLSGHGGHFSVWCDKAGKVLDAEHRRANGKLFGVKLGGILERKLSEVVLAVMGRIAAAEAFASGERAESARQTEIIRKNLAAYGSEDVS